MKFEKFEDVGKSYAPNVAIRSSGQIGLLTGAMNRFKIEKGRHKYIEFYYSEDGNAIGIKPLEEPTNSAIKLRYNGEAADISAKSFLDKYGIDYEETRRYAAEWDDEREMVIVNLDKEK